MARLKWQRQEFEQNKREHARKLHTELHQLAEERLETYQRKFAAIDLNALQEAKFFNPHVHMDKVRKDVERQMNA